MNILAKYFRGKRAKDTREKPRGVLRGTVSLRAREWNYIVGEGVEGTHPRKERERQGLIKVPSTHCTSYIVVLLTVRRLHISVEKSMPKMLTMFTSFAQDLLIRRRCKLIFVTLHFVELVQIYAVYTLLNNGKTFIFSVRLLHNAHAIQLYNSRVLCIFFRHSFMALI